MVIEFENMQNGEFYIKCILQECTLFVFYVSFLIFSICAISLNAMIILKFVYFLCITRNAGRNMKGKHACKFNKQILINPIRFGEVILSLYTATFFYLEVCLIFHIKKNSK